MHSYRLWGQSFWGHCPHLLISLMPEVQLWKLRCPSCRDEISKHWWHHAMYMPISLPKSDSFNWKWHSDLWTYIKFQEYSFLPGKDLRIFLFESLPFSLNIKDHLDKEAILLIKKSLVFLYLKAKKLDGEKIITPNKSYTSPKEIDFELFHLTRNVGQRVCG